MAKPVRFLSFLALVAALTAFSHSGFPRNAVAAQWNEMSSQPGSLEDSDPEDSLPGPTVESLPDLFLNKIYDLDPTQGSVEQPVGYYAHGHLMSSSSLDNEGRGFIKIFRARNRGFTSFDMTEVISIASEKVASDFPDGEKYQIGDLSSENGGRLSRHASHQNGLDGDFAFFRNDHHGQDPENPTGFEQKFVENGKLTSNFDIARNWAIVKSLTATNRINRIFVDPVIKKALCRHAVDVGDYPAETESLRILRPLGNHRDHMHVRITCPLKSPRCQTQAEVPSGSGCPGLFSEQ